MSRTLDTGGPAFPFYRPEMRAAGGKVLRSRDEQDGMSLRDYFATHALAAIIASGQFQISEVRDGIRVGGHEARTAYAYADAMLAAREEVP